ncbi:MAG TPA: fasciclin domain-containing protein [Magnetospirillaceae bacterium]|jgi:uncharacterized surface protein with fasciclin (FAS1) repeats
MTLTTKLAALGGAAIIALAVNACAMNGSDSMAMKDPDVGGAAMYPSKTIVDNAVNSKDHTTLVAAVKAAGLVDTLKSPGPFTVFAPTNEAFAALPAGTVDTLLKPENKSALAKVLTYHVVSGRLDSDTLDQWIMKGGGNATLTTVEGGKLWVKGDGKDLTVTDESGMSARITIADVYQSNGVIFVVDKVLMPKG